MRAKPMSSRWTYAEFARLPSDGRRREVIAGELYVSPAPRPLHQRVVARLTALFEGFVSTHELGWVFPGPIDVIFAEGDYLEPDLVFVRRERAGIVSDRGIEGPPDLVIEVTSESTADLDRGVKRLRYAHFGVPEYWVVDALAGTVEVFGLTQDAGAPVTYTDVVAWRPHPGAPALEFQVEDVVERDFR